MRNNWRQILNRDAIIDTIRRHLSICRERYHVHSLALFGSAARDEHTEESDIDLLVSYTQPPNSDDFFDLKFFLEDLLKREVDLVTEKGLRPAFRDSVLHECIDIQDGQLE